VRTGATAAVGARTVPGIESSMMRTRRDVFPGGFVMLRNRVGGRGGGATETVFQMRQRMFSIGDDFWIETNDGRRAFKVDGKALRIRKTLILEGPNGQPVYTIKEKLVSIREVMTIDDAAGNPVATVKKALVSPLRERYTIALAAGGEWQAQGNIVDHEYRISGPSGDIAEVGKRWFRVRDTYGIHVQPGNDEALVVAIAVVIDEMSHATR
jgi:uncharacterized protein YxjI